MNVRKFSRCFFKILGCLCLLTSLVWTTQVSDGATSPTVVNAALVKMSWCDDSFCVLRTPFANKAGLMVCSKVGPTEPPGNSPCDAQVWCLTPACVYDAGTLGCSCWGQGW